MGTSSRTVPTDAERDAAIAQARQEDWDAKLMAFARHMTHKIQQGDEATAKFANHVTERGLYHAIEWSAGPAVERVTQASLWNQVYRNYHSADLASYGDPVKSLRPIVNRVTRELVENFVRKSSTSEITNAASGHEAQGKAYFVEDATGMIEFLTGKTVSPSE